MNFSHGTYEEHAARIAMVRDAATAAGRAVAVMQDLQGPKIRTGPLAGHRPVQLVAGATFSITTEEVIGDAARVSTTYSALPRDVRPGDRILLSDGAISLRVVHTSATEVTTEVVHGGALAERQGVNLPGVDISIRGVTDKDLADLRFGLQQGVDIVAISFVRTADEVRLVKRHIAETGADTPVIAKLEKPEAFDVLDEIIDAADGVMVARGDLGVELAPEKVPLAQKRIIKAANRRAKPVITATQMLESMVRSPRPTRAEASDVANAILDGSDAVMLSGETAVGRYPVEAIATNGAYRRRDAGGRAREGAVDRRCGVRVAHASGGDRGRCRRYGRRVAGDPRGVGVHAVWVNGAAGRAPPPAGADHRLHAERTLLPAVGAVVGHDPDSDTHRKQLSRVGEPSVPVGGRARTRSAGRHRRHDREPPVRRWLADELPEGSRRRDGLVESPASHGDQGCYGIPGGGTRRIVACSKAYANSISRGSLHAVPAKLTPKGRGCGSKPSGSGGFGSVSTKANGTITVG